MRPWTKFTNEELVANLQLWLLIDGIIATDHQREFFEEVIWRLLMSNREMREIEHG